jgi:RNA polymerase-binding transcription factor DksA
MALTPEERRELGRLIEVEHRAFAEAARAGADQLHAARQVRALEAARDRLADGTYGRCIACGRDIEIDRLIAYPAAVRCLNCQDRYERLGPGAGNTEP